MIWLLGEPEDSDLVWLAVTLQRRGIPVECVLPEDLLIGSTLTYRIDDLGMVCSCQLHDGRLLTDQMPGLVINRLTEALPIRGATTPADAAYVAEEWRAALVAGLRTLRCPLLNPPRAGNLAGPVLLPAAWRRLAHAHGLPTLPWASTETITVSNGVELVMLGARCYDPSNAIPPVIMRALAGMTRFVGAPLLGATFTRIRDQWFFVEATARPRLAAAGEVLINALLECVERQQVPQ